MLNLICGESGAGKTAQLLDSIRRDVARGKRCYLLVPEQQAYISEAALPTLLPEHAGMYFEIVNFSGLADDAFRIYGGIAGTSGDSAVSSLLMWDTLRTLSPLLKQYGKGVVDGQLTALMLSTVSELRSCGITSEALESAAGDARTDARLAGKLSDIALIHAEYQRRIALAFDGDPEDKLGRFAALLDEHAFFADCSVYVDSFTDFTAPEYDILRAILKQADEVSITLCANAFHSSLPHFAGIRETEQRLRGIAREVGCEVSETLLAPSSDPRPCGLRLLSRELWRFSSTTPPRAAAEEDGVLLLSAPNIYEEAEATALHILELVQGGMRYRDVAVIVRDTEIYRGVLDAALERYGIPYFLSERTDLSSKPLARLILCALRAAAHNYRREDVIALLKTGLCGVGMREGSMFEEYCETWHISGKRMTDETWSMNPDGLSTEISTRGEEILRAANEVRTRIIPPLMRLSVSLRAAASPREMCEALYDYLLDVDVPLRLSELARRELSLNQRREASETVRLYARVTELLTTLCRTLKDTVLGVDEFICAISLMLSNSDLGSVPNEQDCVVIGSAALLRVENVRASLLLGLCEGEFPAAVSDDGIFTDSDKSFLEGLDIIFHSKTQLRNSQELFYVYRAIAKPTEHLMLSTVEKQTDGSARTPSLAMQRAAMLLGRVPETVDVAAIEAENEDSEEEENLTATSSLTVSPATAPASLSLSQTRITTFVRCPYLHHLKYVLALREPKDSTPSYADDGTFLHHVFEGFLRASLGGDGKLCPPSEEEIEPLADRIITKYLSTLFPEGTEWISGQMMHLFARLRKLALLMLRDILEEIEQSAFTPAHFEIGIGKREESSLPPVTVRLSDGSTVHLTGRMDRIDLCEVNGRLLFRVVDYKTGEHKFSADDIVTGLDLQLVLYLFAFCSVTPDVTPYGAQYIYAKNVDGATKILRSGFCLSREECEELGVCEAKEYEKGLTRESAEDIEQLQRTLEQTVTSIAERMLAGEAQKTPSKESCKYCPIRGGCSVAYRKGKE